MNLVHLIAFDFFPGADASSALDSLTSSFGMGPFYVFDAGFSELTASASRHRVIGGGWGQRTISL